MNEPTTTAGRALVSGRGSSDKRLNRWWRDIVSSIERQAVADWLASEDAERALAQALDSIYQHDPEARPAAPSILESLRKQMVTTSVHQEE